MSVKMSFALWLKQLGDVTIFLFSFFFENNDFSSLLDCFIALFFAG